VGRAGKDFERAKLRDSSNDPAASLLVVIFFFAHIESFGHGGGDGFLYPRGAAGVTAHLHQALNRSAWSRAADV